MLNPLFFTSCAHTHVVRDTRATSREGREIERPSCWMWLMWRARTRDKKRSSRGEKLKTTTENLKGVENKFRKAPGLVVAICLIKAMEHNFCTCTFVFCGQHTEYLLEIIHKTSFFPSGYELLLQHTFSVERKECFFETRATQ